jgi:hypothetical protein
VSQDRSAQSLQSRVGDHIRQRFSFLEPLGFGVVRSGEGFVRWQCEERSITLSRDWRDGYLDLTFRIESPNGAQGVFGLKHALEIIGATDVMPGHDWAAWELDLATRYVDELASIIENRLLPFLRGDASLWTQAANIAAEQAREHWRGEVARRMRHTADEAWKANDWNAVIGNYGTLQNTRVSLTRAEQKRLDIAKRKQR